MTAVAHHPATLKRLEIRNLPITSERVPSSTTITMTGTATIPLITAAHTNALIGLSFSTLPTAPNPVASTMAA